MAADPPGGPLGFEPDPEQEARAAEARRARPARREELDLSAGNRRTAERDPAGLFGGASRYGWFVGVVGVLVIALIALSPFRSESPGPRGITPGGAAPPFAAPLADGNLEGDVNVAVAADSGDAGAVPACSVRRPDVLNLCALYELGPVVLAFFATRGEECIKQLDLLDEVARGHPRVRFAAVSIRGDRDELKRIIRERRWRFPVGYDRDGILANAYGVAICPQITFLRRGGAVQDTSLGAITGRELEARVRRLER